MSAGAMRHRITLQRNTPTVADFEQIDSWSDLATVWAEKREPKGKETVEAMQVMSSMTVHFRIRYYDGLTTQDRVSWDGRAFDIRAVTNPDGRKRFHHLVCTEHRSDGD